MASILLNVFLLFILPGFVFAGGTRVPCAQIDKKNLMTVLVIGQSNAANHGQQKYQSRHSVYSYHNNECYRASDPLPGATAIIRKYTDFKNQKPQILQKLHLVLDDVQYADNILIIEEWINQNPI